MSGLKIYLDDERLLPRALEEEGGWTVVRTPWDFRKMIAGGLAGIDTISFDNDLGIGREEGWELLNVVEQMVREKGEPLPHLYVHTANPAASKRMHQAIASLRAATRGAA